MVSSSRMYRGLPTAVACSLLLLAVAAGAAETPLTVEVSSRDGALLAPEPLSQTSTLAVVTPWLVARQNGGIAYFAFTTPARIERFDLAASAWMPAIPLTEPPTAFVVDNEGLYLSFGRRTAAMALDGTGERHLRNTNFDARELALVGDFLIIHDHSRFYSVDKLTGALLDSEEPWYALGGLSSAPGMGRIFGRSVSTSPGDILYMQVMPDGTLGAVVDSPYHGDYPNAQRTWIAPGEAFVMDNSGIGYFTGDLTYGGSFAGAFDDIAFLAGSSIVLRGSNLIAYSPGFRREGEYALASAAQSIATRGTSIFAFSYAAGSFTVEEVGIGEFSLPAPGAPVDPHGLAYVPDAIAFDGTDIVYLLHRGSLSVFRWSLSDRGYLLTIPLVKAPSHMALSTENQTLYFSYPGGEITAMPLTTQHEAPFVNTPQSTGGLAAAGQYLFAEDPSGAWATHYVFSPAGTMLAQREWNYWSREYVWNAANRRMYFFRDEFSPNDIHWEEILTDGSLGAQGESPYHSSAGIQLPIRVKQDGSLVLLGSGFIYDGLTLLQVDTLSNIIADAVWGGGSLITSRSYGGQTQLQKWGPTYGVVATRQLPGTPIRLLTDGTNLLLINLIAGIPEFTVLDYSFVASGFSIRKSDGLQVAEAGDTLQYEIVVTNLSPATITGASVQDVLPPELVNASWSCAPSPGSICASGLQAGNVLDTVTVESGDSLVYTLTATIADHTGGVTVSNTASVQEPGGPMAWSTDHTFVDDLIFYDGFEDGLGAWFVSP